MDGANATAPAIPEGLLLVPFGKGCVLLLTPREITAGIRRGKWWRRRTAEAKREANRIGGGNGQASDALLGEPRTP